ncbi:MAG: glutamine--fructose-6-phosphate transaminase (isomerizing) [Alphaproteobacteria bacterium]|nr:glutamine--fructose-6-phosphate transaminase (isomerizing) [Alphaproteobacteria bacterium]
MCGIIGILGADPAAPRLVQALKLLEYRGYDSAGVATLENGAITRRRAAGKLANLAAELEKSPLAGVSGIGHTRWATHGAPTTGNAHPHATDKVAIVHNGIIENFRALREELAAAGHKFSSETDSEVIAHLITDYLDKGQKPEQAAISAVRRLEGAFGIAVLFAGDDDILVGARKGSPLAVGLGDGENFLGSDAIALSPFTQRVMFLEEGDIAVLSRTKVKVLDAQGMVAERKVHLFAGGAAAAEKGNHRHFMQKEIYEQPETIGRTITRYVNAYEERVEMPDLDGVDLSADSAIVIGCGTAHYAGRVAEYWLEQISGIAVETDIASEFRYRKPAFGKKAFSVFVSQSGETADTLAALRYCKENGLKTLAVVNVPESTIWREADARLPTLAGPEIGVASTKAFTAQLSALAALAIAVGRARGTLSGQEEGRLVHALMETPRLVADALACEPEIEKIALELAQARDVLYLGRGVHYPIALEGALKLKEISYIHAEGYAAGELKHGPIALIDEHTPVVVVAPHDALFEKTLSNMQEVNARGGKLIVITDAAGAVACADIAKHIIMIPACDPFIAPLVYSVPIQLLAYFTAVHKGTDVDQPRNLAKSVTVE